MADSPFALVSIKSLSSKELLDLTIEHVRTLMEDEALAILDNRHCSAAVCQAIAQNQRLTSFYSVRMRLVAHRLTPLAHATKLVHYLYWPDLLRMSTDVKIPPPVRRAIETQLMLRLDNVTVGERMASARRCSPALIKVLLFDREPKVFAALLLNPRLREEDLLILAESPDALPEQLQMLAADPKWSYRYAIRRALAMNPLTPRSAAASQLRHLSRKDLRAIHASAETSVYLRRCIERLQKSPVDISAPAD